MLVGGVLLILTQKNSQKFGDVLGIMVYNDEPIDLSYDAAEWTE